MGVCECVFVFVCVCLSVCLGVRVLSGSFYDGKTELKAFGVKSARKAPEGCCSRCVVSAAIGSGMLGFMRSS